MEKSELLKAARERAKEWLSDRYDPSTRAEVKRLLETDENTLIDSFYTNLEFGTGGLRGVMGVGTNRMNIYTAGMATQGLSNYLKMNFGNLSEIKVAIAHDCRNNSRLFAETAAGIFAGNGFKVYLFEDLRPTPELSFAIRHFKCQAGIVITASHNPKEYNGYKAYWDDGAQVISPHDKNIITEVEAIKSIEEVKYNGPKNKIESLGAKFDEVYTDMLKSLSLAPEVIKNQKDLKIVYTPIHGTGVNLVPLTLNKYGFTNVIHVPEQDVTNGNFPTVHSPNPEEAAALAMALDKAKSIDADILMGTDPDADRVGIAVKDDKNQWILLNGNQTGALLFNYLITKWAEKGKLKGNEYIVKTIVTSDLLADVAGKHNIKVYDVLTGFKYIAGIMRENEGKSTFICGAEESYGYLVGDAVRDKDAIMSCALLAEAAAWAKDQGKSFYEQLLDIYTEFGYYKEHLVSIYKKGVEGAAIIKSMMESFRNNPPESIAGTAVVKVEDYLKQTSLDMASKKTSILQLPKSDVLQYVLKDGSKISIRPSGTEPKIKFYISIKGELKNRDEFIEATATLNNRIQKLVKDLGIE
jgi:phosphoglucomutase